MLRPRTLWLRLRCRGGAPSASMFLPSEGEAAALLLLLLLLLAPGPGPNTDGGPLGHTGTLPDEERAISNSPKASLLAVM